MFCDPLPPQLLSKIHFFSNFWHGVDQGGIKHFTSWEPMLSVKNFARNSGSKMRQKYLNNSGNSTLNKLNLLFESLYECLDFCFFILFKLFSPWINQFSWFSIKKGSYGHTISSGKWFFPLESKFLPGKKISMSKANFFMWRYFLPVKESSLYEISSCKENFC